MVIIESILDPEAALGEQVAAMADTGAAERCFALRFSHCQNYLPGQPALSLVALVALHKLNAEISIELAILLDTPALISDLDELNPRRNDLKAFSETSGYPWLDLSAPLQLSPVFIAKPWGREIWYTGIESRGQSSVVVRGRKTPLPWLLALAPNRLLGDASNLVLLKVLDPYSSAVFGDLYFEVHKHKREVYVVTHIDSHAWPGGVGGIRYGFSPQKRARYPSDAAFKRGYLEAVQAYEQVRKRIDREFDDKRLAQGIGLSEPLSAETLSAWQAELPSELSRSEERLRDAMESYTAVRPLNVGDIVKIPPMTPHSLLHGVRVVEFQTPDYDRQILSFGQKVLTQSHWDTADIIDDIDLESPPQHPPYHWVPQPGLEVEELAAFPDFEVIRVQLGVGLSVSVARLRRCFPGASAQSDYLVLMGLEGSLSWSEASGPVVRPNEAQWIPAACQNASLVSEQPAVFLVAKPRRLE